MKPLALALLVAGFALPAGDPSGFYLWKSAELKGFAKTLAPKMSDGTPAKADEANLDPVIRARTPGLAENVGRHEHRSRAGRCRLKKTASLHAISPSRLSWSRTP